MKKAAIYGQSYAISSENEIRTLVSVLEKNNIEFYIEIDFYNLLTQHNIIEDKYPSFKSFRDLDSSFDIMFTIGGDGTFLRSATHIRDLNIPILGINTGRFVINTTIGILGFVDAATLIGFEEYEKEDYGQTLAVHGIGPGCYLVLPVLGPKTARDTLASTFNFMGGDAWYNITVANDTQYVSEFDYYASRVTAGVDFRAKNYDSIENLQKNSLDFYASVKSVYLQDRQQKILNSNEVIESMDDSDWEEIEN